MRILIIDDDNSYRQAMEDILSEYGYDCRCLQNGDTANEVVKEFKPDVVLCDLKMPMSGFSVAYHISQTEQKPLVFGVTSYFDIHKEHWLVKLCNFKDVFDKKNTQVLIDHLKELQCHR